MTNRFKPQDVERDRETLHATTTLRKAMEQVEFNFFAKGFATWEDVVVARDEYIEAWEERRNFIMGEKYGMTRAQLQAAQDQFEEANQG